MIIAELPEYLSTLGGAEWKGMIIGVFTLSACLARPFSGKLADKIGRKPVMMLGLVAAFAALIFYPVLTTVSGFLVLRFLHGLAPGFHPTGTSAFVADVVPLERRGEAMGWIGFTGNIGTAIGPYIGGEIVQWAGYSTMFYVASLVAVIGLAVTWRFRETLPEPEPFHPRLLYIARHEWYEPLVHKPALVMFLSVFAFGAMLTVIPDLSTHFGAENKGTFLAVYTLSSLGMRVAAGRYSDRWGRVKVLRIGSALLVVSMLGLAWAQDLTQLLGFGVVYGMAVGIYSPALFAWAIDLGHPEHRGRAFSTIYIALEMGIGIGAVTAGAIYANDLTQISHVFLLAAGLALVSSFYLWRVYRRQKRAAAYA